MKQTPNKDFTRLWHFYPGSKKNCANLQMKLVPVAGEDRTLAEAVDLTKAFNLDL